MSEEAGSGAGFQSMRLGWGVLLLVMLFPVLVNGFPFVFSDSWNYMSRWDQLSAAYPPFYSLFVWPVGRVFSLYMVVILQAALVLYVVWLFVSVFVPRRGPAAALPIAFALIVLTQLPWLAGWLMPDLFAGLGGAAYLLLLFADAPIRRRHGLPLFVLAVFSTIVSTANLLVFAGFVVVCLVIRLFAGLGVRRCHLAFGLGAVALSAVLVLSANAVLYKRVTLNMAGPALFFAKLTDAGIAQSYLHETFPAQPRPICRYLPELDGIHAWQGFLWANGPDDTLAVRTDAWEDKDGAFARLNRDIVWHRFPQVAGLAAGDVVRLFGMPALDAKGGVSGDLTPQRGDDAVREILARDHPGLLHDYDTSRQQKGWLKSYPAGFYMVGTYLSYAGLLVLALMGWRNSRREMSALGLATLTLVVLSLVVQGGLVGAYARYHVKVSWLAWLVVLTALARLVDARQGGEAQDSCDTKARGMEIG